MRSIGDRREAGEVRAPAATARPDPKDTPLPATCAVRAAGPYCNGSTPNCLPPDDDVSPRTKKD